MPTDHKPTVPPQPTPKSEPRGPHEPIDAYFRRITGKPVDSDEGQSLAMGICVFGTIRDPSTPNELALDVFNRWLVYARADSVFDTIHALVNDENNLIEDHRKLLLALGSTLDLCASTAHTSWAHTYNLIGAAPRFEGLRRKEPSSK